ncbi:MAG: DRTGG domain-containing protein [Eubacteriales bacterium]
MELKRIKNILDAQVLYGEDILHREVFYACGCDLMSDVLRFAKDDIVLLTGLTNIHVLKTADMANIQCIIFVRNKTPNKDIIDEAKNLNIVIMRTEFPLYEACGRLYKEGLGDE